MFENFHKVRRLKKAWQLCLWFSSCQNPKVQSHHVVFPEVAVGLDNQIVSFRQFRQAEEGRISSLFFLPWNWTERVNEVQSSSPLGTYLQRLIRTPSLPFRPADTTYCHQLESSSACTWSAKLFHRHWYTAMIDMHFWILHMNSAHFYFKLFNWVSNYK